MFRRVILLSLLLILIPFSLSAALYTSFGGGVRKSIESDSLDYVSISVDLDNVSFFVQENGLFDTFSFQTIGRGEFSKHWGWRSDFVVNCFSSKTFSLLLDGYFDYRTQNDFLYFSIGMGVQGGTVKYPSLNRLFFSLSPLVGMETALYFWGNTISFSYSFLMPYERQLKAVPSLLFSYKREIGDRFELSLDSWVQFAEYLMDPWNVVESYGLSLSMRVEIK